jgi:GNAT superfamily N-acetyltransferase
VSHGIDPKHVGRGIEAQLYQAALERTRSMGCQKLRGFRFGSKWH